MTDDDRADDLGIDCRRNGRSEDNSDFRLSCFLRSGPELIWLTRALLNIIALNSPSHSKERCLGNSLVVQWLEHCAFTAEGPGVIPDRETRIPPATRHCQKQEKEMSRSSCIHAFIYAALSCSSHWK